MVKINTTKRVIKVANSIGIIIDKKLAKHCNINQGNFVEISLKKIKNGEK